MAELASSIGGLSLRSPTRGRQPKDRNINTENVPTFVTRSLPPADANTRLIAVCGITDKGEEVPVFNFDEGGVHSTTKLGRCSQQAEGWFVSDFYCMKALYSGTCASQIWLHSEHPKDLVNKHGAYAHGNPYKDRKEVLSSEMLHRGFGDNVMVVPRAQLKSRFCELLRQEAQIARRNAQSLLVMTFGHGDEETYAVNLGEEDGVDDWFEIEDFKAAVCPVLASRKTAPATDLSITYLTTACYSGGWTVRTDLNVTIFAAAGPEAESSSWQQSPSCGRYCGSVFATALRKAWEVESEAAENLNQDGTRTERTLKGLDEEIYDALHRVDREALSHDVRFTAQDDHWDSPWSQRTGIPLADFKKKWEALRTVLVTADPESVLNPSPSNKMASATQGIKATGGFGARFPNVSAARQFMLVQVNNYMNSFPGPNNVASNTTLHGQIRRLRDQPQYMPMGELEYIFNQVRYRQELSHRATWLLKAANIPLPNKLRCSQFDEKSFQTWMLSNRNNPLAQRYNVTSRLIFENILPHPTRLQGSRWRKPHHYIAVALAQDGNIGSESAMRQAVKRLEEIATTDMKRIQRDVECNPEIRGRKRKLFEKIGKRVKSLSPDRFRRKRASTSAAGVGPIAGLSSPPLSPNPMGKGKRESLLLSPPMSPSGKGKDPSKN